MGCWPGKSNGLLRRKDRQPISFSLPQATRLPLKVTPPITTASRMVTAPNGS